MSTDDDEEFTGQKWEYEVVPVDPAGVVEGRLGLEGRLNELGSDGWELAGTVPLGQAPGVGGVVMLVMKRPLTEE